MGNIRELKDHVAPGTDSNLSVEVHDKCDDRGAHHLYRVYGFHTQDNASAESGEQDETRLSILFQNGTVDSMPNGVTNEVLLAIVADRLRNFQSGLYCRENEKALEKVEESLMWLHKRTHDRMSRGVDGTHMA
jgi:hypothetical protein